MTLYAFEDCWNAGLLWKAFVEGTSCRVGTKKGVLRSSCRLIVFAALHPVERLDAIKSASLGA
jgi:hypothetical protein